MSDTVDQILDSVTSAEPNEVVVEEAVNLLTITIPGPPAPPAVAQGGVPGFPSPEPPPPPQVLVPPAVAVITGD